jgi:hypothetical protein
MKVRGSGAFGIDADFFGIVKPRQFEIGKTFENDLGWERQLGLGM